MAWKYNLIKKIMSDNGSDLEFDNGDEEFRDHDNDGMEPMDHTER